ncbi:hypothetical protein ABZ345_18850 [Lentzea sp. NPDC005914]
MTAPQQDEEDGFVDISVVPPTLLVQAAGGETGVRTLAVPPDLLAEALA